jgi:heat shock protein HslJ
MRLIASVSFGRAAVLAILLAACAAPAPPATPTPTAPPDTDIDAIIGEWRLEQGTLNGRPVPLVPEAPITLTVNAVRIGGTSACNSYGADWVFTDDGPRPGNIAQTLMGCEDPVQLSEVLYLQALARATDFALDGDRLVFSGEGVELRFVRAEG